MSVEGILGVASLFGLEEEIQRVIHERSPKMKRQIRTDLQGKTTKREADPAKLAPDKTQGLVNNERTVESELPQGRGERLVTRLDSAVNQAEQLRDQQIQQQYSDQLGVYVQEKAQQIDRLKSSLTAVLTSEQVQLQAIQQRPLGWTAGKKAHAQSEQQVAREERPGSRELLGPGWQRYPSCATKPLSPPLTAAGFIRSARPLRVLPAANFPGIRFVGLTSGTRRSPTSTTVR